MARLTRSHGNACFDPVSIADWEELAAADSVVDLRRLVSKWNVKARLGAPLDTVRTQLIRLMPVVPLTAFRSASARSAVAALLLSAGVIASRSVQSVAGQRSVRQRADLSDLRSYAQSAQSRRPRQSASETDPAPRAVPSSGAVSAPARVQRAGTDAQSQSQMRRASRPPSRLAPAGQHGSMAPPEAASERSAAAVQDSRVVDVQAPGTTVASSQSQQQPGRNVVSLPQGSAAAACGTPPAAVATSSPPPAATAALLPSLLSALSALQQQQSALQQQQVQVASQLTALTHIVQQLQDAPEPAHGAAGSTEANANVPAATGTASVPAAAPVDPAPAQADASIGGQQGCPPAHAPGRKAGSDLVFLGLPLPPVIAGRSYMPAHRAVLRFCKSQLRIDLRPQDITVRQVFGRMGKRSVVVVRFRSNFVVNSIIVAKSVLLDGSCPVSIEFSRPAAVRQGHSALRQQRRSAVDRHEQEAGGAPSPSQAESSQANLPQSASDQPAPASIPVCRRDTSAAASLPES